MKKEINLWEHAGDILAALQNGVLLTTKADGRVNSMTISWGTLGIEWGKPIFTTFVRAHRFTHEQLEKNGEFTVNIPVGACDKKILGFCGSKSGRDVDKAKALGLTLVPGESVSVPAIGEYPLTLECKVVYKQFQGPDAMLLENPESFYPQNVDSNSPLANKDYHTAYCGEIVRAYIVE